MHNLYLKHISVWTVQLYTSWIRFSGDETWAAVLFKTLQDFECVAESRTTVHTFVNNLLLNSLQIASLENIVYLMFMLSPGWDYEGNLGTLPALWEHPVLNRRHPGQQAIMLWGVSLDDPVGKFTEPLEHQEMAYQQSEKVGKMQISLEFLALYFLNHILCVDVYRGGQKAGYLNHFSV